METVTPPVRRNRRELHMADINIEQKASIASIEDHEPDVIFAEPDTSLDYLSLLAFNEEPVTIRLEPTADKFASRWVPCWVNGKGAEVLVNGSWVEFGYLPVARPITIKRKYVEVLIRSKRDTVNTAVIERDNEDPQNMIERSTTSTALFSVLEDRNPKGAAWATELRRRAG
jgi:hypothetical protein